MKSTRTPKGQFKNGTSGNPAGRPAGSRNKVTLVCEQMLQGDAEELIRALLEKAKAGNLHALGMCLDRILPARKERCIQFDSGPISNVPDLSTQFQNIASAVAEGNITPTEGESMSTIFTSHARVMEIVEFDRRIAALEDVQHNVESYRTELKQFVQNDGIRKAVDGLKKGVFGGICG